jgi:hypothetical protein
MYQRAEFIWVVFFLSSRRNFTGRKLAVSFLKRPIRSIPVAKFVGQRVPKSGKLSA